MSASHVAEWENMSRASQNAIIRMMFWCLLLGFAAGLAFGMLLWWLA